MDRAYLFGAIGTAPTAPASPSIGHPTGGVPGTTPATEPGPYWFEMITEELRAVVVDGSLTPAQGTLTQVRDAIRALIAANQNSRPGHTYTSPDWAWIDKARGVFMQWGDCSHLAAVVYPTAFPNETLSVALALTAGDGAPRALSITASGFNYDTSMTSPGDAKYIVIGH